MVSGPGWPPRAAEGCSMPAGRAAGSGSAPSACSGEVDFRFAAREYAPSQESRSMSRFQRNETCSSRAGRLAAPVERLRKRADFLGVATGARAPAAAFVLQTRARADTGPPRVGFTVSKKVGNAVERNRVRRRLREIVRLSDAARLRPGNDYVLIGRRAALNVPFARLIEDFCQALERIHQPRRAPDRSAPRRRGDQVEVSRGDDQKTS
jgi:ribonuclease P protein component